MPRYRYRRLRKPKRRLYKSKGFWFLFLFLIIIGYSFYFVFFSDFLKVKNIEVSGAEKIGADNVKNVFLGEISKKMFFFIPKNILSVNFDKLSYDISSNFPEVEKISIKINLPDTVSAEIIEKTPAGCWCKDSNCNYFDRYGIVYQQNSKCDNLLTIVSDKEPEISKQVISEDNLKDILKIFNESIGQAQIKDIRISDDKVILESKQGWIAYFKPYDDISGQIVNLKAILEQKVGANKASQLNYIDLRFGNKVFYKFKDNSESKK